MNNLKNFTLLPLSKIVFLSFLCFGFHNSFSQTKTVTGIVSDSDGYAMPGVNIIIKGSNIGSSTDFDGMYTVEAQPDGVIIFSYLGFSSQEISVENRDKIDVTMRVDISQLDEVVVVGYGQKSRATLTGAVSTTTGDELIKSPQPNVSNSLAGRVPGVIGLNRTGEPGVDGSTIRIRGISTTGDNNPLIVIDGVANRVGGLERLNPNDIENVTVLKDASAAIYGSQAANGVILITTKRGASGKPKFSFTHNQSFLAATKLPEMAASPTYARISNEINFYRNPSGGLNQIYSNEEIQLFESGADPDNYANTDWVDESIKDFSLMDNQNLSVRGGGDKFTYYTSLGRLYQDGIYRNGNNKYDQINLRSNLDMQVTDNLKITLDIGLRKEGRSFPTQSAQNIFRAIYRTYPTIPARYSNGLPSAGVEQGQNPIVISTGLPGTNNQETNIINTNLNFEYNFPFLEGLSLNGLYSEDRSFRRVRSFSVPFTTYQIDNSTSPASFNEVIGGPGSGTPELYQEQEDFVLQTANLRLGFERVFNKHHVNLMAGYEQQESNFREFTATRTGFISDQIPEFDLGGGEPEQSTNSGYSERFTRQNFFGRVSYDFAQKYLIELQARYDGSSRFADGKRLGFFPSISAGWRLSEEEWFKNDAVSNLKFKASYGLLGNDRIDPFQYLNTYTLRQTDFVDNNQTPLPIFIIDQLANPNITWETAKKFNVGFELGLFNTLSLGFDYFSETREDLLTARSGSLPLVSGIVNEFGLSSIIPQENIGEVENKGFEVTGTFRKKFGKFDFFASANFTHNKNEVVFLDDPEGIPDYQVTTGKPLGSELLYEAIGIFRTQEDLDNNVTLPGQQLGDLIYRDVDNDGEITELDRVRQEITNVPQIIYGFSFGGEYKNFDFSVLFQGQAKSRQYVVAESGEVGNFFSTWADNRWSPNNPDGTYPRVDVRTSSSINEGLFRSDFWLVNTSFLRLKNVEIGYTFSKDILKGIGAESMRLSLSGFNLATFTKAKDIDPEGGVDGNGNPTTQFYPQQKIYNIGINVNF